MDRVYILEDSDGNCVIHCCENSTTKIYKRCNYDWPFLRCLLEMSPIIKGKELYTDVPYLIGGIVLYRNIWKHKGYINNNGVLIDDVDLWMGVANMGLLGNNTVISYDECKVMREKLGLIPANKFSANTFNVNMYMPY